MRSWLRYLEDQKYGWNWVRSVFGRYAYPVKSIRKWLKTRKAKMGTKKALERYFVDIICTAGEDAVHAGHFTRSEINQMYLAFGKRMGLTELMPKQFEMTKRDIRELKGAILNRVGPEAKARFKDKQRNSSKPSMRAIRSRFRRAMRNTAAI